MTWPLIWQKHSFQFQSGKKIRNSLYSHGMANNIHLQFGLRTTSTFVPTVIICVMRSGLPGHATERSHWPISLIAGWCATEGGDKLSGQKYVGIALQSKEQISASCISYHKDGGTMPLVLFGFQKQDILHLGSLLWLVYRVTWEADSFEWDLEKKRTLLIGSGGPYGVRSINGRKRCSMELMLTSSRGIAVQALGILVTTASEYSTC